MRIRDIMIRNGEILSDSYKELVFEQISLMDFLADQISDMPNCEVEIKEVANVHSYPICDYEIKSTYTDIFMIINMIDDYVGLLKSQDKISPKAGYMIERFEKISESFAEQIELDKEKMWKRCRKKQKEDDENAGEDALVHLFGK